VVNGWQGIIVALTALTLIMGCASSPYVGTGAALGGGLGALTGAAIGNKNPWAGAAVGGLVGTALGAAGGYAIQQRRTAQPPQGYYYQPAPPGYGPPPGYGYNAPQGPYYGYSSEPPAAGDSYYSQNTPPQPEGCRTPMKYAPYYY
jgi:hypothetical protein